MQHFIVDVEKYNEFQRPKRVINRRITHTGIGYQAEEEDHQPKELKQEIKKHFSNFKKSKVPKIGQYEIGICAIEADDGDGMTWTAEIIHQYLNHHYPDTTKVCISSHERSEVVGSEIPLVAKILGKKKFKKLLYAHFGEAKSKFQKFIVPLLVIVLLLVFDVVKDLMADPEFKIDNLTRTFKNPNFWIILVLVTLATWIIQHFWEDHKLKENGNKVDEHYEKLNTLAHQNTQEYRTFVEKAVNAMQPTTFRIVILDDFYHFDKVSLDILKKYLLMYNGLGATEYWIILDEKISGKNNFRNFYLSNTSSWVFQHRTSHYNLEHINSEEKQTLFELLGLSEEALNYKLIKTICEGQVRDSNYKLEELKAYRKNNGHNENNYGEFELFYLLSFIATPMTMFFSKDYYAEILAKKTSGGIRQSVLQHLLKNTKINKTEFLEKMRTFFIEEKQKKRIQPSILSKFVRSKQIKKRQRFAIVSDIKNSMINNYQELNLTSPPLVHLFWALYWGDNIQKYNDAVWHQKLHHHLIYQGNRSVFNDVTFEKIGNRLTEIYNDAIQGCLTNGLYGNIYDLLDDLSELSKDENFPINQKNRIVLRFIEAYIILQNPKLIQRLEDFIHYHKLGSGSDQEIDEGCEIFWDLIPGSGLNTEFNVFAVHESLSPHSGSNDSLVSVRSYATSLSIWFKSLMRDVLGTKNFIIPENDVYRYLNHKNLGFPEILSQLKSLRQRLSNKNGLLEIDLMTISNMLWNIGLDLSSPNRQEEREQSGGTSDFIQALADYQSTSSDSYHFYDNSAVEEVTGKVTYVDDFKLLVNEILELIGILNKLSNNNLEGSSNDEYPYFRNALITDVYCNIFMTLSLGVHGLKPSEIENLNDSYLHKVNQIIESSNQILSYQVPQLESLLNLIHDRKVILKINGLLKLCVITWRSLALTTHSYSLGLKRIQFDILLATDKNIARKVKKAASEFLRLKNIFGLIGNFLVTLAEGPNSMKSYFFLSAFDIAKGSNFGLQLQKEMFILLQAEFNFITQNNIDFSNEADDFQSSGDLFEFLETLNPSYETVIVTEIFNFFQLISSDEIKDNYLDTISEALLKNKTNSNYDKLAAMVEAQRIKIDISNEKQLSYSEIAANWKFDKTSYVYSGLLKVLIYKEAFDKDVLEDAMQILNKQYKNIRYKHFLNLAISIAEVPSAFNQLDQESKDEIIEFIANAISRWAPNSSPRSNIRMYKLLINKMPEKADEYRKELTYWHEYEIEIKEQQLKYFLKNRQFFDVIRFFFNILSYYGLKTDIPREDLFKSIKEAKSNPAQFIEQWRMEGNRMPKPIINSKDKNVISSQFLIIGNLLFESSAYNNKELDHYRQKYNKHSSAWNKQFFDIIQNLPSIPPKIQAIIIKYSSRLDNYINPEDASA